MKLFILINIIILSPLLYSKNKSYFLTTTNKVENFSTPKREKSCSEARGILVLAHGKSSHHHFSNLNDSNNIHHTQIKEDIWENTVLEMVGDASSQIPYPLEIAFGMWDRKNFQEGVTLLANQSVCELIIIPLYISDYSDVIRAQKYQFHLSEFNPLPFDPGRINIPQTIKKIEYRSALNTSKHLSQIISNRASEISTNPIQEELILVAHGPNGDNDDLEWIRTLTAHANRINLPFYKIHTITLRDDAPDTIRDRKTRELQNIVWEALNKNNRSLIVPILLAPGGIEEGLKQRLNGFTYTISPRMLAPDSHLIEWIVQESLR